jgi:DNA ligase 1
VKPFRVMLAKDYDPSVQRYPVYASAKLDGIRAYVKNGVVLSRSNKPIPNKYVQQLFGDYEDFDGELVVGDPTDAMCFRNTTKGVMSVEGTPDVRYFVFDVLTHPHRAFRERRPLAIPHDRHVVLHEHRFLVNDLELQAFETECLIEGYEGVILRCPEAPYKQGRSTVKEGGMLKVKTFVDSEAIVIGFEERMHNLNEAMISETGHTKRSSHKDNKVGHGDLGVILARWVENSDVIVRIGIGFTMGERERIWREQDELLGAIAKFKYFPVGGYEAPRHAVFLGFRSPEDML